MQPCRIQLAGQTQSWICLKKQHRNHQISVKDQTFTPSSLTSCLQWQQASGTSESMRCTRHWGRTLHQNTTCPKGKTFLTLVVLWHERVPVPSAWRTHTHTHTLIPPAAWIAAGLCVHSEHPWDSPIYLDLDQPGEKNVVCKAWRLLKGFDLVKTSMGNMGQIMFCKEVQNSRH